MVRILNISEARTFLRIKKGEIERMSKEDGLPMVIIPGERKELFKIPLLPFYKWLKGRATGAFMSYDEFCEEIKSHLEK